MYWPFKTTVKFITDDARELCVKYLDSANSSFATKCELQRRFISQEVFGYVIEKVAAATNAGSSDVQATIRLRSVIWVSRRIQETADGLRRMRPLDWPHFAEMRRR